MNCYIIGETNLTLQCAQWLVSQGHELLGIVSSSSKIRDWAIKSQINHIYDLPASKSTLLSNQFDYLFSIANPTILKSELLDKPSIAAINYHDAPLPYYAGVHATSWAIWREEKEHGITWHVMEDKVDTGPIIIQKKFPIDSQETAMSLNLKCHEIAFSGFRELIEKLTLTQNKEQLYTIAIPQDHNQGSYYGLADKPPGNAWINWNQPGKDIERLFRATKFGNYTNRFTAPKLVHQEETYLIAELSWSENKIDAPAGMVIAANDGALEVATQDQTIITIKQLKTLTGDDCTLQSIYNKGNITPGTRLTIPDNGDWESYKEQSEILSKYEPFWLKEWKHFKPAAFPFLETVHQVTEGYTEHNLAATFNLSDSLKQKLQLAFPETKECDLLLSLLMLYLYRLGNDEALGVALHQPSTYPFSNVYPSLVANSVPFSIALDYEMDFDKVLKLTQSQLEKLNQKKPYLRDIFSRYPAIQSVSHPVIAIRLEPEEKISPIIDFPLIIYIHQQKICFLITPKVLNDNLQFIFSNIAGHLQILLENIVQNYKKKPIIHFPLLTTMENNKLLEWNNTQTDYPRNKTIPQLFEEQVEKTPNNIALIYEEQSYTYKQLNEKANQLAHYLLNKKIKSEALLGIYLNRSLSMIVAILAVWKVGATYIPLNPDHPKERIKEIITDSNPVFILSHSPYSTQLKKTSINIIDLDYFFLNLATNSKQNLHNTTQPHHLAYVLYTSGTTGSPKGVLIEHKSIVNLVLGVIKNLKINSRDRLLNFSAISFDASIWEIFPPLIVGAKLYLASKNNISPGLELAKTLHKHAITIVTLPPSILRLTPCSDLHKLRIVISAGEACFDPAIINWKKKRLFVNAYGPTETTVCATIAKNNSSTSIGKPFANTKIYVLDQHKQLVPIGIPGELYIGGDGLARGYLNQSTLTKEKFIPNPFYQRVDTNVPQSDTDIPRLYKTGDRARWLPDGNLEYLGRFDNQVKIRGFRIEIEEIEGKLNRHPLIEQAVVVVNVTENQDKQLIAFIVEKMIEAPLTEPVTSETLRSFLKDYLPYYMVPSLFYKTETLPITPNGKIDRKKLAQLDWTYTYLSISNSKNVLPETPEQKQLLTLWQKLLANKNFGIHDNFFSLGGDSIVAMRLVGEAQEQGLLFTVQDIFEGSTIAQLANRVKKIITTNDEQAVEQTENNVLFPLTPIQHWFFEQKFPHPEHFSQVCLVHISAGQETENKEKLKAALQHCLEHYSIFRLRFKKFNTRWQQYYTDEKSDMSWSEFRLTEKKDDDFINFIRKQQLNLQQQFNLETGPLFATQFITREKEGNSSSVYLLIVIHHLIIDGVSWRILLQNLERLYTTDSSDLIPQNFFTKASAFQQWSEALQQRGQTLLSNMPNWIKTADTLTFNIPLDYQKGPNLVKTNQTISQILNNKATHLLLHQLHTRCSIYPYELLTALLVKVLAEWRENSNVLLDLESHGRQEITPNLRFSHTLGWFTSLYPVYFQVPQSGTSIDKIQSVVKQLRSILEGGIDYGINHYLSPSNTNLLPYSLVNFNYWGQFDQLFSANSPLHFEKLYLSSHPANSRLYLLAIEAKVNQGQLQIDWNYSENYHCKETIQRLVTNYFEQLEDFLQSLLSQEITDGPKSEFSCPESQEAIHSHYSSLPTLASHPLSPMQKGLYFYGTANPHSEAYIVQLIWELKPNLNDLILHEAFKKLIERHTILRTYFKLEGTEPQQRVKSNVKLPWKIYDWRGYSKEKIASLLQNDRKKGFKFDEAPLLRVALIHEDYPEADKQTNIAIKERRKIVITFHHILMDGWCLSPLLQELGQFYQALEHNTPINLSTPTPYQHYTDWLHKQDLNAAKCYWQTYFHDLQSPATTCSLIQSPNEKNPFVLPDCRSETFSLSLELTLEIQQFLQANGLTLNSFMQGLWGLLLHYYTGNPEVLSGATFSDRLVQTKIQPIIGLLINTLPLYLNFTDNINGIDYFQKVQRQLSEVMRYNYTPLADVKTYSKYPTDKPLFETLVITENYPEVRLTGLDINFDDIEIIDPTHYPLAILVIPDYRLHIKINYDANRISTENVQRLFAHLKQLCSEVINKTKQPIQQLHYLPPAEQQLILQWSQGDKVYLPYQTVVDYFEQGLQKTKRDNHIAAIYGEEKITYAVLNNKANQLAHYLIQSGVKPGDFIAIYVERSLDMLVGILAILKTGAAYVPLDPGYPEQRLQYMLQDCDSQFVLTQKLLTEKLTRLIASLTNVKTVVIDDNTLFHSQPTTNISPVRKTNTPMYLVYTSGSTGNPKPIQQTHQTIVNLIYWQTKTQSNREKFNTANKSAQFSSFGFDVCVQEIFFSLLNGLTLYIIPETLKKSPDKLVQFILDEQINQLFLPTAFLNIFCQTALQQDDRPTKWHHLQHIIVAGEKLKLNNTSIDFFKRYQQIRLHNHYGPSETHVVTAHTLGSTLSSWPSVPSIGKPIDNTHIYILDKLGRPVPPLMIGELWIAGVGAQGYLNQSTAAKRPMTTLFDTKTPLHNTGDLAYWSNEGNLYYVGRRDEQIKILGHRVELSEIEIQCEQYPGIEQAAVIAKKVKEGRQQLLAYLVPQTGKSLLADEIRQFLRGALPKYMIPTYFITVSELPVTANGKVDKQRLVKMYPESSTAVLPNKEFIKPTSTLEKQMAKLWSDILAIPYEQLSMLDSFSDLGGDSLAALQFISSIKDRFGVQLETTSLYQQNGDTIQSLACKINELQQRTVPTVTSQPIGFFKAVTNTKETFSNCLVPLKPTGNKLPLFLVHPVGGSIFWYLPLVKYWDPDRPLYAIQDPGIEAKTVPFQSVEDMASFYIKAIQSIQPDGPYLLGGASAGATTSVEMARQLNTSGKEVAFIASLDGWAKYPDDLKNRQYFEEGLRQQFETLKLQFKEKNIHSAEQLFDLQWTRAKQNAAYTFPESKLSKITLFKASTSTPAFSKIEDANNYWDKVFNQVEVYMVPGAHDTMFQEPHVQELAKRLRQCLDKPELVSSLESNNSLRAIFM